MNQTDLKGNQQTLKPNDGFLRPSKEHFPVKTISEMVIMQKRQLSNYVAMLDDPALEWGASGSRTKNQRMFREIRRVTKWLRDHDALL
jgi:hypothetical protein